MLQKQYGDGEPFWQKFRGEIDHVSVSWSFVSKTTLIKLGPVINLTPHYGTFKEQFSLFHKHQIRFNRFYVFIIQHISDQNVYPRDRIHRFPLIVLRPMNPSAFQRRRWGASSRIDGIRIKKELSEIKCESAALLAYRLTPLAERSVDFWYIYVNTFPYPVITACRNEKSFGRIFAARLYRRQTSGCQNNGSICGVVRDILPREISVLRNCDW